MTTGLELDTYRAIQAIAHNSKEIAIQLQKLNDNIINSSEIGSMQISDLRKKIISHISRYKFAGDDDHILAETVTDDIIHAILGENKNKDDNSS